MLTAACSRAAAPIECVTDARGEDAPLGVAIIRRDGDRARIEVGLRGDAGPEWTTRELDFQPGDDETERLRALGFAIGTLIGERREVSDPEPQPAAPPRASSPRAQLKVVPKPPQPSSLVTRPPPRRLWFDAAAQLGLGLVPGPARTGALLRAGLEFAPGAMFAVAETGYSARLAQGAVSARWWTLAAGVGHPVGETSERFGLELRGELLLEHLRIGAHSDERSDVAERWKPALAAALDARLLLSSPVSALFSASAVFDPRRSVVRVSGADVAETPTLGLNGFLGLRVHAR